MQLPGLLARSIVLCLTMTLWAGLALAQDATAPAAKPAVAAKPALKPGEVVPFDQPPAAPVPASPAARKAPAKAPAKAATGPAAGDEPQNATDEPAKIRPEKTQALAIKPRSGARPPIGALLPLSGPLATQGQSAKAALDLAVADFNEYLTEMGSADKITLSVQDTASSPATALERLKALAVSGVRLVIGPYSDNEVDGVLDFANKNGIILLSPGSAGPYLAKPGDNLYRFSPTDAYQAEAIAVLASQEGSTHLICIWEGDMYGDELVTHVKGQFANQGGQVVAGSRFRPEATQMANYVADLKAQADKAVKDKKKLAIVVAARGDHTAAILREAAKIGGLDDARWYGGDDAALRGSIVQDQNVAKFAAKVRMAFARLGDSGTELYSELEKRLEDKLHAFVDTQALVAYDVLWLASTVSLTASSDSADVLRKAVATAAERFYGTTGWMAVNAAGDRREDYDFDFWTVKFMDGKYYWVKTARYQFDPGSVKQLIINAPEKE